MDLPPIAVEFEAKIAKAMADVEILKKQIKSVGDVASRQKLMEAAQAFEKSLKSGAATSAIADMYRKIKKDSEKAGQESARGFWRAFKKELKNEKNPFNVPGWLPWVGAAMPLAPAAITGIAGSLGGLATAGLGAAAGIAAIGVSAATVLAPVKQAFTTIDKLTTTNAVAANATALQTWLNGGGKAGASKVTGVGAATGGASGFTIADANARIAMLQGRISNATTPSATANYTAQLAAAQRHLTRLQGGVPAGKGGVSGSGGLGAGLGFLANPNVNWYTMTPKQQRNLVVAAQSTSGLPDSEKKQISALMSERQAYTMLNKPQQQALFQYTKFDSTMVAAQQKSQPQILGLFSAGLKALTPAIKFLHPLTVAATQALMPLIKAFGVLFQSKGFATFMGNLEQMSKLGIKVFGGTFLNFFKGFMNIFDAFAKSPATKTVTNDLLKMSAAFAKNTAKKSGGFADFMNEVKQNAPTIDSLLRNLVAILGNLITSMGGGFGAAELKGLNMFFTLLNKISSIPGLGPLVYNLTALLLITSKFGSFKIIGALFDTMGKGLARMAALKFGTMVAGMIGLDTAGMGVAEMWKTIGKNVLTFAGRMAKGLATALADMTVWVAKMIARGAVWVARMIVQGVTVAASWIASAAAAAAAWVVANATMILVSGGIVLLIGAIVVAVFLLVKHWRTVWGWIKDAAKAAWDFIWNGFGKFLLPLLGPVGLIALGVIEVWKHWRSIWGLIKKITKDFYTWIWSDFGKKIIDFLTKTLPHAFGILRDFVSRVWRDIEIGALKFFVNLTGILDRIPGPFQSQFRKAHDLAAAELAKLQFKAASTFKAIQSGINAFHGKKVALTFGLNLPAGVSFPSRHIKGRGAKGISGAAAGTWLVGEEGPELAYLPQGTHVLPARPTAKIMGGLAGGTAGPQFAGNFPSGATINADDAAMMAAISTIQGAVKGMLKINRSSFSFPGGGSSGPGALAAQHYAASILGLYGWGGGQMGPLISLWNQESGWRWNALNSSSGAYGIPQSLPASKMAAAGADWRTNPATQIRWGLGYIRGRYGSPSGAWAHEQGFNWYGNGLYGGIFNRPTMIGVGDSGAERVDITPLRHGRKPSHESGSPVYVSVYTQEIRPQYHAAQLGWELARRAS